MAERVPTVSFTHERRSTPEIAELDDIEDIFTTSTQGVSFVMVELEESAPAAERLQQIRDEVQDPRACFPPSALSGR